MPGSLLKTWFPTISGRPYWGPGILPCPESLPWRSTTDENDKDPISSEHLKSDAHPARPYTWKHRDGSYNCGPGSDDDYEALEPLEHPLDEWSWRLHPCWALRHRRYQTHHHRHLGQWDLESVQPGCGTHSIPHKWGILHARLSQA